MGRKSLYNYEIVKLDFEKLGFILLENIYIDTKTPMQYICSKHPNEVKTARYSDIRRILNGTRKSGCRDCGRDKLSQSKKFDLETVSKKFSEKGFILLDTNYKNQYQKLRFQCPKNPKFENYMSLQDLRQGYSCKCCTNWVRYSLEEVREIFKSKDLELISKTYKDTDTPLEFYCIHHHGIVQKKCLKHLLYAENSGCKLCFFDRNRGSSSPHWRGGITNLSLFLREQINDWKLKTLEQYNYKCFISGENHSDLDIHHLIPFSVLRDKTLKELNLPVYETIGDYAESELSSIVELFLRKHFDLLGVPLRKDIHQLFHNLYGKKSSIDDFEEFKNRYYTGEFKDTF